MSRRLADRFEIGRHPLAFEAREDLPGGTGWRLDRLRFRTRSAEFFASYSFGCAPPSSVVWRIRLYAVATRWSRVGFGRRSPASCPTVNRS